MREELALLMVVVERARLPGLGVERPRGIGGLQRIGRDNTLGGRRIVIDRVDAEGHQQHDPDDDEQCECFEDFFQHGSLS